MSTYGNTDKKICEIKNIVRALADVFGMKVESRITAYAEKISYYNIKTIGRVCASLSETEDRFPPLSALMEQLRAASGEEDRKRVSSDEAFNHAFVKEQERLDEILKQFNQIIGKEKINDYVKFWFVGVYGKTALSNIPNAGMSLGMFTKSAMFDLSDAKMNPKRAVEIGIKKLERLQ